MSDPVLSFYDHHRQSYGHMPLRDDRAIGEFMVGDYGAPGVDEGVGEGGEFALILYKHSAGFHRGDYLAICIRAFSDSTGSLLAFLNGPWRALEAAAESKSIRSRDELTALLTGAGMPDRSEYPVGHRAVCPCCKSPLNGGPS